MLTGKVVRAGLVVFAMLLAGFLASQVQAQNSTINLRATLSGSVGKVALSGRADYSDKGANQRSLKVELNQLPFPDGTRLGIKIAGVGPVGFFAVTGGKAKFFAQTNPQDPILGDPVNVTHSGDSISIHLVPIGSLLGDTIATGTFK